MHRMLEISEIFLSLQGEGPLIGRPAIFLRLSGCNLRCIWCDTKYAYSTRFRIHIDTLCRIVLKFRDMLNIGKPLLVITGGEPLLQINSLRIFLERIYEHFTIQLETNGTIDPSDILQYVDYIVVSPKLSNSGNPPELRKLCKMYKKIGMCRKPLIYFKFVIDRYEDIYEVNDIVSEFNISKDRVFLMPQCSSLEDCLDKMRMIYKLCVRYGYSMTTRLQYLINIR